ncbi:hypothetical protein [Limnospira fusiformis]|uniref:hypothetical protein n=1 Tax=Limnospira fusiformis TaxID=54297 RepID=UPI0034E0BBF4
MNSQEITAIFDGQSLQLESPLNLEVGTRLLWKPYLPLKTPPRHFYKQPSPYSYKGSPIGPRTLTSIYTETPLLRMIEVFLDTSFAIALSSITDQHHGKAV